MSKKTQTVAILLNNFNISWYFVLKFEGEVVHGKTPHLVSIWLILLWRRNIHFNGSNLNLKSYRHGWCINMPINKYRIIYFFYENLRQDQLWLTCDQARFFVRSVKKLLKIILEKWKIRCCLFKKKNPSHCKF